MTEAHPSDQPLLDDDAVAAIKTTVHEQLWLKALTDGLLDFDGALRSDRSVAEHRIIGALIAAEAMLSPTGPDGVPKNQDGEQRPYGTTSAAGSTADPLRGQA